MFVISNHDLLRFEIVWDWDVYTFVGGCSANLILARLDYRRLNLVCPGLVRLVEACRGLVRVGWESVRPGLLRLAVG